MALARAAEAAVCAVFIPRKQAGLALVCQDALDQTALDVVHGAWARRREDFEAGRLVRYGQALIWPLFLGPRLVGIGYFNPARDEFPDGVARGHAALMAERLAEMRPAGAYSSYMATGLSGRDAIDDVLRDQLAVILDGAEGNVSMAARQVGMTRQAIYNRADRLGMDVTTFRKRRARTR
jgi:hypothetical protein